MHPDAFSLAAIQLCDFGSEKCVNNVFRNQNGILEIWETLTVLLFAFGFLFSCSSCFKTSPQLLQLFRRMLQCCFAVKLQKCFMDYATSLDFPSSRGWVDNDWIHPLKETCAFLKMYLLFAHVQAVPCCVGSIMPTKLYDLTVAKIMFVSCLNWHLIYHLLS